MIGEYKEKLPSGSGELIVSSGSWNIQYYFPGIDSRYNGTFIRIKREAIDNYINAFKNNWIMYNSVKEKTANLGGEIKLKGEMDMTINIGGHHDGVCIQSYHMPLNTEEKINKIISDYCWAKERAEIILVVLKELN